LWRIGHTLKPNTGKPGKNAEYAGEKFEELDDWPSLVVDRAGEI
jgi:hypothetical protein